jgi:hypothetical protein
MDRSLPFFVLKQKQRPPAKLDRRATSPRSSLQPLPRHSLLRRTIAVRSPRFHRRYRKVACTNQSEQIARGNETNFSKKRNLEGSAAEWLLPCSCEVAEMRRRSNAVAVIHPATRKAHTIKLSRRTTGAAMTVAVFAKARPRLTRANPKFYEGRKEGCCEHCDQGWH